MNLEVKRVWTDDNCVYAESAEGKVRRTHLLIGRVWQMPRRLNGKIFIFRRVVFIGHK